MENRDEGKMPVVVGYADPSLGRRGPVARVVIAGLKVAVVVVPVGLLGLLWTGVALPGGPELTPVGYFNGTEGVFGWAMVGYLAGLGAWAGLLAWAGRRRWVWRRAGYVVAVGILVVVIGAVVYRGVVGPLAVSRRVAGFNGMLAYGPDGGLVVGMDDGAVQWFGGGAICAAADGAVVRVQVNAGGDRVLFTRKDGSVELRAARDGRVITTVRSPAGGKHLAAAFASDGKRFAVVMQGEYDSKKHEWTGAGEEQLWVVSAEDGAVLSKGKTPTLGANPWQAADFRGDLVAAVDCYEEAGRGVLVYDVAKGERRFNLVHPEYQSGPLSVRFSPDGALLAVGYAPYDVGIWDVRTGKLLRTLRSQNNWVVCLDFSPDGRLLASGEGNSAVRLWDVATGREVATFLMGSQMSSNYTYSLSFDPTGRRLACGTEDGYVVVWRVP